MDRNKRRGDIYGLGSRSSSWHALMGAKLGFVLPGVREKHFPEHTFASGSSTGRGSLVYLSPGTRGRYKLMNDADSVPLPLFL